MRFWRKLWSWRSDQSQVEATLSERSDNSTHESTPLFQLPEIWQTFEVTIDERFHGYLTLCSEEMEQQRQQLTQRFNAVVEPVPKELCGPIDTIFVIFEYSEMTDGQKTRQLWFSEQA